MKKINILIGSMLVALIALISFQWYWIQNAYNIKNADFDRVVNDVLKETTQRLEKNEILYLTRKKIEIDEKKKLLEISKSKKSRKKEKIEIVDDSKVKSDSMVFAYHDGNTLKLSPRQVFTIDVNPVGFPKNDIVSRRLFVEPEMQRTFFENFLNAGFSDIENFDQRILKIRQEQQEIEVLFQQLSNQEYNECCFPENSEKVSFKKVSEKKLAKGSNKPDLTVEWTKKNDDKADLVKDVFKEFSVGKRSIDERLGHVMLDTLLKKSFKENGIDLPFFYKVTDDDCVVFANLNGRSIDNSEVKNYKAKLFPNDAIPHNQFLQVEFPNQNDYIFKNLWNIFGTSLLLIIFIGGVFYYSVNTMLSQKKLAGIKNDFINNMTHELKTPVSTIGLALELIKDKTIINTKEKTEKYLDIIEQENKRLGSQIETVLQTAKLEKGDIQLKTENLEINEILDQVVKNHTIQIEKLGAELHLDLNALETMVHADKVHLTNIFYNLLDNAIKYSDKTPCITISTRNIDHTIEVSIADKGIGIPKEHLNKIFDKFYRVPKGDLHDVKGFGLGLNYVKNMVQMHQGTVEVFSKIDQGSIFTVTLPLINS